ncbi:MAG: hypothetical protein O3B24_03850 [Verrucomicrobia bacterium]|nr:hypothetical protein [Verrucomicrobiota bacterium]
MKTRSNIVGTWRYLRTPLLCLGMLGCTVWLPMPRVFAESAIGVAAEDAPASVDAAEAAPHDESLDAVTGPAEPATTADLNIDGLRDPFWPSGWKPPPVSQTTSVATKTAPRSPIRWEEATRLLVLTSLAQLPDGGYLATLKGIGVIETGDKISVNYSGLTYHWEVLSISEKGIAPRRLGVTSQRGS